MNHISRSVHSTGGMLLTIGYENGNSAAHESSTRSASTQHSRSAASAVSLAPALVMCTEYRSNSTPPTVLEGCRGGETAKVTVHPGTRHTTGSRF
jgi:hypothetical protein